MRVGVVEPTRRQHAVGSRGPLLGAVALALFAACTPPPRPVPVRVPCLPSEEPPIPRGTYGTVEHAEEYINFVAVVTAAWIACAVDERKD
jgi:hypothetical protein